MRERTIEWKCAPASVANALIGACAPRQRLLRNCYHGIRVAGGSDGRAAANILLENLRWKKIRTLGRDATSGSQGQPKLAPKEVTNLEG